MRLYRNGWRKLPPEMRRVARGSGQSRDPDCSERVITLGFSDETGYLHLEMSRVEAIDMVRSLTKSIEDEEKFRS